MLQVHLLLDWLSTAIRDGGSALRDHQPVPDLLGWAEDEPITLNFRHPLEEMNRQLRAWA